MWGAAANLSPHVPRAIDEVRLTNERNLLPRGELFSANNRLPVPWAWNLLGFYPESIFPSSTIQPRAEKWPIPVA